MKRRRDNDDGLKLPASKKQRMSPGTDIEFEMHAQLSVVLNQHKYTDVSFVIGPTQTQYRDRYDINRLFLSSVSNHFDELLYGDDKLEEFVLADIDSNAFQSVLKFAYCNNPNLSANNVLSVLYICEKYHIPVLTTLCNEYFENNIRENNVCILLNEATKWKLDVQRKQCLKYLEDDANAIEDVIKSDGFKQMSVETMRLCLQLDALAVKEEIIWEMVLEWANHQSNSLNIDENKSKLQSLGAIKDLIRFPLMSGNYFVQNVMSQHILSKDESLSVLAYSYAPSATCIFNTTQRQRTMTIDGNKESVEYDPYTDEAKTAQRKTIHNLLTISKYTDVTFVIGHGTKKREFSLNRLFLAIISPVFEGMLFGQMEESKSNSEVVIDDIDCEAFDCILNFAYCANPKTYVTTETVLDVLCICDRYQIIALPLYCQTYFDQCIHPSNVCFLLDKSLSLKLDTFSSKCIQYVNQSTATVIADILNSDSFYSMKASTMRVFLQCTLPLSEEEIWEKMQEWANRLKKAEIVQLLKSVRDLVRFGLMDGKYFAKYVVPLNILTQQELVCILLYFQNPDSECGAFNTKRRIPKPKSPLELVKEKLHDCQQKNFKLQNDCNVYQLKHVKLQNDCNEVQKKLNLLQQPKIGRNVSYTLRMSSKFNFNIFMYCNTYSVMMNDNLNQGCATDQNKDGTMSLQWIEARFSKTTYVYCMDIGPPGTSMGMSNNWSCKDINGQTLQYSLNPTRNSWITICLLEGFKDNESKIVMINKGVKALRITNRFFGYIGLGKWKIYGK